MNFHLLENAEQLGQAAAKQAAKSINKAIAENGYANIILATGASQFTMLENLVKADIDWSVVTMFHLDEYIGLPETHPASFRKYLKERFVEEVDSLKAALFVEGDHPDPAAECARLNEIIEDYPIDVAMVGIGENGHLAFNDPPADFEVEDPYIIVRLDEDCRKQQMGEGWFTDINKVPTRAISMSIQQILKSDHIIVSVPDRRKAEAVSNTITGPVDPHCPASILQTHPNCDLYLDKYSAWIIIDEQSV